MLDQFRKHTKSAEEQVAELQALVTAAREERAALSAMLGQVQAQASRLITAARAVDDLDAGVSKVDRRAGEVRSRLDRLQEATSSLADDLHGMHDVSRLIRDEMAAIAAVAQDIEQRLGTLRQFQELSRAADERLTALHELAAEAAEKMQALDGRSRAAEQSLAQVARLDEVLHRVGAEVGRLEEAEQRAKATFALARETRRPQETPAAPPARRPAAGRDARISIPANVLLDSLIDLRTGLEVIASRGTIGPLAAAGCARLRDMTVEAQTAIASLHQGPDQIFSRK